MTQQRFGRLDVQLDGPRAVLAGRLDDSCALADLAGQFPQGEVVIDTAAVWFVNSIGMREWTRLVRALKQRGNRVVLERVADVLMTQMNLVSELAAAVAITSFHAQYACNACGGEHSTLVEVAPHAQALRMLAPPKLPCPECAAPMELGDFPERYLSIFK